MRTTGCPVTQARSASVSRRDGAGGCGWAAAGRLNAAARPITAASLWHHVLAPLMRLRSVRRSARRADSSLSVLSAHAQFLVQALDQRPQFVDLALQAQLLRLQGRQ